MELQDKDREMDANWTQIEKTHKRGKIMGGLLITAIGSLFLAKELGAEIPAWLLSWKMLLIGLGIVTGIKHKFRHPGWILLIAVGAVFLMNDMYPEMHMKPFLWPVLLIVIGLCIIFKPHRKNWQHRHKKQYMRKYWHHQHHHQFNCDMPGNPAFFGHEKQERERANGDDYIDSTACFGGVKKNIVSKKFRGGDVTNIFGGTEINLMQADIEDKANLEITQVFGGTKLIVPAHWEIKSEIVAILGTVEDKRPVNPTVGSEPTKVLVLVGTTVLGGIEIRSY